MSTTGIVTISVEIELGWSLARTGKLGGLSEGRERETAAFNNLISMCEEYNIPISFDIVGHLMIDGCSGDHKSPHDEGWFDIDPGDDEATDPRFYAPDLVEKIQSSRVDHEIATHTFSHVLFDEVSADIATWEFRQAKEIHKRRGVEFTSLVTPRHRPVDPDIVKDAGIDIVRMPADTRQDIARPSSKLDSLREILSDPPVTKPTIESGVVYTYSSRYPSLAAPFLPSGHARPPKVFRAVPLSVRQHFQKYRLNRAAKLAARSGSFTHLWCHLYDLAPKCQQRPIRDFFETLNECRNQEKLSILTMADLNDHVRRISGSEGKE